MQSKILLIDDSNDLLTTVSRFLANEGHHVSTARSRAEAVVAFEAEDPDLCIVDYELPDGTGFDVILEVLKRDPKAGIVMLTGHGTIGLAVDAIKLGADQFLTKPVNLPSLGVIVQRSLQARSDQRQRSAQQRSEERARVAPFIGTSRAIQRVQELATAVVKSHAPVLLTGETGTGKGVLARWLHEFGPRGSEAFVDLNCAGLSRELAESELFGHQRGSFTSANATKRGLLELAHHGSLFLDEIGELDPAVQPKLLKVLEDKTFRRIGDVQSRTTDVRLISATHRDLTQLSQTGEFRSDLLFRINTVEIELPALRERREDIGALAGMVLEHVSRQLGRGPVQLSDGALHALEQHTWPGNIRELRNVLERALLFCGERQIGAEFIAVRPSSTVEPGPKTGVRATLEELERQHILAVLQDVEGKVEEAARILAIPRSSLYAKLKRYGAAHA
jgi:DNA-binding NtrC family response regulator